MPETSAALDRATDSFRRRFAGAPTHLVRSPGRATLLGAHVDYSEGWVLPLAIERSIWVACRPRRDRRARLWAADLTTEVELDLDHLPPPLAERRSGGGDWHDYVSGIAWALAERGLAAPGIEAVIAGDLPMASGLSSSAALEAALLLAWQALAGWRLEPLEHARLGHRVETGYLGLQSGIMDQFAVLHARAERAVFLDCRTLGHELLPWPAKARLVIVDSGVGRKLVGSPFNDRRRECQQAVELLRRTLPGISTLRDVSEADLEAHGELLPELLQRRARHVVGECARARAGAAALRDGDLAELGRLMRRSHESSRDHYQVSLEELDLLAATAWQSPGCHGARFSGAGFGGCVAALVEAAAARSVAAAMEEAFERRFGRRPQSWVSGAAAGAERHEPGPRAEARGPSHGC